MNPNFRHDRFRLYRDKLMGYQGDMTEVLCLNWAENVRVTRNGRTTAWRNISGSAWYLKLEKYDDRDETLVANHRRGLYYTWLQPLYSHALFLNFAPATYLITSSKVAHMAVPAVVSRRRGPQLTRSCEWNVAGATWTERATADDGFATIADESGPASNDIRQIANQNPLAAERVLALSAGKIGHMVQWHNVRQLDSCAIQKAEVILRMTFCQDTHAEANDFRIERLRRCGNLWNILTTEDMLPPSFADFKQGFNLAWSEQFPHQNAISAEGRRATAIYMGEGCNTEGAKKVKKTAAAYLQRSVDDPDESIALRQRLAVWYRDNGVITICTPQEYVQIDQTGNAPEFDISREK